MIINWKILFTVAILMVTMNAGRAQKKDLPKAFRQILPRGAIAAITHPQFVPAKRAKIRDNAWILGVVIDGQARAYSLNLLNSHEVVNDQIGSTKFAAVW